MPGKCTALFLLAALASTACVTSVARVSQPLAASSVLYETGQRGREAPVELSSDKLFWTQRLGPRIQELLSAFDGEFYLYVEDVSNGASFRHNADRLVYLSSAIKLVVALEVLWQVDAGLLSLQETVLFTENDVRDGIGPLVDPRPGTRLTISELLKLMMVRSDNAAADLLMHVVSLPRIEAQLARRGVELGAIQTLIGERRHIYGRLEPGARPLSPAQVRALGRFERLDERAAALSRMYRSQPPISGKALAESFERYYEVGENSGSMRGMGRLLGQVARCEGMSPGSCELVKGLMLDCQTGKRRVRAGLPASVPWLHKTGTQYRRACDVGLAEFQPGRFVVISACVRDFRHLKDAERLFAGIGRAVADAFADANEKGAVSSWETPPMRSSPLSAARN